MTQTEKLALANRVGHYSLRADSPGAYKVTERRTRDNQTLLHGTYTSRKKAAEYIFSEFRRFYGCSIEEYAHRDTVRAK